MVKNFVEIGGSMRPVVFDMYALYKWSEATQKRLGALMVMASLNLADIIQLVKAGLDRGSELAGKPVNHKVITICEWLDESPKAQTEILKVFYEYNARKYGDSVDEDDPEESEGE
jgi:hypothetical protein